MESLIAEADDIDEELKKYGDISDEKRDKLEEEREELKAIIWIEMCERLRMMIHNTKNRPLHRSDRDLFISCKEL